MDNFSDTLINLGTVKNSRVILEISPKEENIPDFIKQSYESAGAVLYAYFKGIINAVADILPAVLIDKSAFDVYGPGGTLAFDMIAKFAHSKGIMVITDVNAGGMAGALKNSYEAYFKGSGDVNDGLFYADAITVSPYSDAASLKEVAGRASRDGRGLFMTIRATASSDKTHIENIITKDDDVELFYSAADDSAAFGENFVGEHGYSTLGMITFAGKELFKLRHTNRWGLILVRADFSQLDDNDTFAGFYEKEGEGEFIIIGDDVVNAWKYVNGLPENYAEFTREALKKANSKTEAARKSK